MRRKRLQNRKHVVAAVFRTPSVEDAVELGHNEIAVLSVLVIRVGDYVRVL